MHQRRGGMPAPYERVEEQHFHALRNTGVKTVRDRGKTMLVHVTDDEAKMIGTAIGTALRRKGVDQIESREDYIYPVEQDSPHWTQPRQSLAGASPDTLPDSRGNDDHAYCEKHAFVGHMQAANQKYCRAETCRAEHKCEDVFFLLIEPRRKPAQQ